MRAPELLLDVERYYTDRVRQFGATARGVDWNSADSQELRFSKLAQLWEGKQDAGSDRGELDIVDYGCGYGALVDFLGRREGGGSFRYQGFDISHAMLAEAESRAGKNVTFTSDREAIIPVDYVVASGVFNVKLAAESDAWEEYMRETIEWMATRARRGFGFNALSTYSDAERRRTDLHYADPLLWFDYCKRRHSRYVTLLHDYPLYEFTLLVRVEAAVSQGGAG